MKRRGNLLLAGLGVVGALGLSLALPHVAAQDAAPAVGQTNVSSAQAGAPPIPVAEIIRRFAQHESEFKNARDNYTYTQEVIFEEVSPVPGEYEQTSDIVFTPAGKRYEQVTYAPAPTLGQDVTLSPEDMKDLENIQPFVLTTEDLPKYDVQYVDTEKVDELTTYVFRVGPKTIQKGQRYFQGTVWVDNHDFAVVKSDGKAVPDLGKGDNQNLFPRFVTYRENIEGDFWFPTYTHADDVLHFKAEDAHIRMTVRYKNYKRFGSTIKIGPSKQVDSSTPANPQEPAPQK